MPSNTNRKNVVAIILSAGQSSRMGKLKQLLPYKGETLIHDICTKLTKLDLSQMHCVTGFQNRKIEKAISAFNIHSIYNENYGQGMSSSIVSGIQQIKELPPIDAVLIVLSDQPLIPLSHYIKLISTFSDSNKKIVATAYNNTFGVPAIFDKSLFPLLTTLKADQGAKQLIKKLSSEAVYINCEEANKDIDTLEDYKNLINYQ